MRYAVVLSLFTIINPGECSLWIFSAKCGVIFRIRRISFNMPKGFMRMPHLLDLDLGIGIHT